MHKLVEDIKAGREIRQSLIEIKDIIKEAKDEAYSTLLNMSDKDTSFITELLKDEDAKVRKNTVQIIGLAKMNEYVDTLYECYLKEDTLFVRPEYIKALNQLDCDKYLDQLIDNANKLAARTDSGVDEKHVAAELRELFALINSHGRGEDHRFNYDLSGNSTMILTTLPGKEQYLQAAIDRVVSDGKTKLVRSGVKIESNQYEELAKVRCYKEFMFVPDGMSKLNGQASDMAKRLIDKGLVEYLSERLLGDGLFRFYVSVKGRLSVESKAKLTKDFAREIERLSNHRLVNSPSNYEVTLQLVGSSKVEGQYSLYLIFKGLGEGRFDYRTTSYPTSMKPYIAALICEIISKRTGKCKQVLDPFCGVGTLLVERAFREEHKVLTGVDIYGEAIWAASKMRDKLKMDIQYIDKDMNAFAADYIYDLILTDLPVSSPKLNGKEVRLLYERFLNKAYDWMSNEGYLAVYTGEVGIFREVLRRHKRYTILEEREIYKGKTRLYILKLTG
ncbi:MAG: methyltransferase [Lachnospiraceae bacterium]|nr:methyltransferase [Lachnospiraceae bacterium]